MKKKTDAKMTQPEIETKLKELTEKVRGHRFALAGSQSKNVKEQLALRREIARLMTMRTMLAAQK